MIAAKMDYAGKNSLTGYSFADPTWVQSIELWKLKPANEGFRAAQESRIWQPDVK